MSHLPRLLTAILLSVVFLVALPVPTWADSPTQAPPPLAPTPTPVPPTAPWVTPVPPPERPWPVPLVAIEYLRVEVDIQGQVAITKVDQLFRNPSQRAVEGTYLFPLPEGAAISSFAMYVDGQRLEGELLSAEKARRIYEDFLRRNQDPALLEYVGRSALQVRIFPIPPGGERRIQIEYSQLLQQDAGLVGYRFPLRVPGIVPDVLTKELCERCGPGAWSQQTIKQLSLSARLRTAKPLKAVYSPSHQVDVVRPNERTANVSFEQANVVPDRDFELYYAFSDEAVGLQLLTHRLPGEDGFFLLLASPGVGGEGKVVPRDLAIVLDTSGSMEGDKLRQAKEAVRFILERLNPQDRFNVVSFSSAVRAYAPSLRPASEWPEAARFVESLQARGATNIDEALLEALKLAQGDRRLNVIFLTDGLPTVGETDVAKIIANFRAANTKEARVFAFGVGYDVNTVLLDTVSQESGGFTQYVKPGESVNERVAAFYTKVQSPVLTNLALDFGGARVEDFYPRTLPDLYRGSQLVLVGRYREPAKEFIVTLKGRVDGEERAFTYPDERLPAQERGNAFLPRLWATRKVGYLLNQIRLYGANPEVVQEVVELSKRYGIITPYTSFLVQEPQVAQPPRGTPSPGVPMPTVVPMPFGTPMPSTGAGAVRQAEAFGKIATADVAAPAAPSEAPQLRAVGSKTFLLKGEVWTDTAYTSGAETHRVPMGSSAYFDLLSRYPEAGAYLALGERVILVLEGATYEIVPAGDVGEAPTATPEATPAVAEASPTPTPTPKATAPAEPTGGFGCARGSRPAAMDAAGLLALAGMVALVLRPSREGLRRRR